LCSTGHGPAPLSPSLLPHLAALPSRNFTLLAVFMLLSLVNDLLGAELQATVWAQYTFFRIVNVRVKKKN
jgi:hypothetical protein